MERDHQNCFVLLLKLFVHIWITAAYHNQYCMIFQSTLRPAEWRYSSATRWLRLESSVAVDVSIPVALEPRQLTLLKSMQVSGVLWGFVCWLVG